jgi:A/G-specific adenine glycosylase
LINGSQILGCVDRDSITLETLLNIKGIGNYIARSILIHGKNERFSLIDPNFIRIYKRVFNIESEKRRPRDDKNLWKKVEILLPESNFSEYSYAILDFGAVICKLKNPKCSICPMMEIICQGYK